MSVDCIPDPFAIPEDTGHATMSAAEAVDYDPFNPPPEVEVEAASPAVAGIDAESQPEVETVAEHLEPATGPYAAAALDYLDARWSPVPVAGKVLLVAGYTGRDGQAVTRRDAERWSAQFPSADVALRLPRDVVCLDVDAYDDKPGAATLAALVAEHGPLPPTIAATARALPSGRFLYRVPNGTRLRGVAGPGIEVCQFHHRYIVAPPSVHHSGAVVRWVDEASGEILDRFPEADDLPALPWSWIEALSASGSAEAADAVDEDAVRGWVGAHTEARRPSWLPVVIRGARERTRVGESRHDSVVRAACQMAREATAGAYSADDAVAELVDLWAEVMDDPRRAGEVVEIIGWAVGQLDTDAARAEVAEIRARLDDHGEDDPQLSSHLTVGGRGEAVEEDSLALLRLPAEFWSERPVLEHVRAAALSRMAPPDAVLAVVLARTAALSSHTVELPPNVGGAVGLSLLAGLVGPPEAGKSSSTATGRDLLPAPVGHTIADGLPLGSGEGLAEVLFGMVTEDDPQTGKPTKVRRQVRHAALVAVDEGTLLAELAQRRGSTTLTTLRSIFTHGTIGNTNATAERNRVVAGTDYVYGVVVGIQPALAGPLFEPAAVGAGTPQRFLWAWCVDPTLSPERSPWPGPLDWTPPGPGELAPLRHVEPGAKLRHRLAVPDEVSDEIRRSIHTARTSTDADPLDAHRMLLRLKTAALLGILDGRVEVTVEDWRLAGIVDATSANVRRYVAGTLRAADQQREDAQVARHVRREAASEDAAYDRALASAATSVARKVHRSGSASRRDLQQAIAGKHRQLGVSVDDAVERAVSDGLIVADGSAWKPGRRTP